jgi:hypothetical protein
MTAKADEDASRKGGKSPASPDKQRRGLSREIQCKEILFSGSSYVYKDILKNI